MSTLFDEALSLVMLHEGGYSNNKKDSGGETKYGISTPFLQDLKNRYPNDPLLRVNIKNLTQENACDILKKYQWDKYNLKSISYPQLAIKLFDMSLPLGINTAIKILQLSCNKLNKNNKITADGVLGIKSSEAINNTDSDKLLNIFISNCIDRFKLIAEKNPNDKEFLNGWISRASDFGSLYAKESD
jgi:lysozyme family protein